MRSILLPLPVRKVSGFLNIWLGVITREAAPIVALGKQELPANGHWIRCGRWRCGLVVATVPVDVLPQLPIHSNLTIAGRTVRYSVLPHNRFISALRRRAPIVVPALRSTAILRQNSSNGATLTVRETQPLDSPRQRARLLAAYVLARLQGPRSGYLFYEKHASRYEESAAAFFEYFHAQGRRDGRFILDSKSPDWHKVPAHLVPYVLKKHSFKHYVEFFRHRNFWGTEVPDHAIDLRNASRIARNWATSQHVRFVFLQHGVMLMISLGSDYRADMRKGHPSRPKHTQIVASSESEAQHFYTEGGYQRLDLIISGLPKFDLMKRVAEPQLITIMPTWRHWDYNLARVEPQRTTYAKFIEKIIESVPPDLLAHVRVAPHPHMSDVLALGELNQYRSEFSQLDELLANTRVLITDYSSVAFDAFHRGAAVIFAWQEIEQSLAAMGGALALQETDAFGPVTHSWSELKTTLNQPQSWRTESHLDHYQKLVQFHDGNNRARLFEHLVRQENLGPNA